MYKPGAALLKKLNPRYADVKQPNFAKLAVGFGAKGFEVNGPDAFREIDKALAVTDGPERRPASTDQ